MRLEHGGTVCGGYGASARVTSCTGGIFGFEESRRVGTGQLPRKLKLR